jgi:hypothetical protein
MARGRTRPVPRWSTPGQAVGHIVCGRTWHVAARVAAVVGTILTLVNQGSVIADGDATAATWVRTGFNYLVPYVVSSIGFLAAGRTAAPVDTASGSTVPAPADTHDRTAGTPPLVEVREPMNDAGTPADDAASDGRALS